MINFNTKSFIQRALLIIIFSFMFIGFLKSNPLPVIRISVENTLAHVQTKSVQRFVELITSQLHGQYDVEFYPSASLFKDADIFRALAQGKVEIAVPGTWHFDKAVPEVGLFLLPSLYGQKASISYGLMESNVGKSIIQSIEKNIDVKVLGRLIDLGHTHIFLTDSAITSLHDFKDKKIRVAGGVGNSLRVSSLGATPLTIAWPALSLALKKKTIDALLTSYESMVSAKLHQQGITYVYEDNEYFAQYIPITSRIFWEKLSPNTQNIILTSWETIVDEARIDAKKAQEDAKAVIIASKTTIITPSDEIIKITRDKLLEKEKAIALEIGISPQTYTLFSAFFENIDTPNYELLR